MSPVAAFSCRLRAVPPLALARVAVTALLAGCAVANVDADANAPPCGRVGLPCCDDAMGLGACAAPLTCGPDRVCAAKPDGAASDDAPSARRAQVWL